MRMSCNGCRVLRKGCNENCSIKPCLDWIKSSDSQSNATLFLAKFYGRAGLLNLVNAAPNHLRPDTFKSLLYESCGRMVNPIYGSVGLVSSGQWHLCQAAVEAVLKGLPITPIPTDQTTSNPPIIKGIYDIRHVTKQDSNSSDSDRIKLNKNRLKRTGSVLKPKAKKPASAGSETMKTKVDNARAHSSEFNRSSTSHDSSVSHPIDAMTDINSNSCMASIETTDGDVSKGETNGCELELDLTLGFGLGYRS